LYCMIFGNDMVAPEKMEGKKPSVRPIIEVLNELIDDSFKNVKDQRIGKSGGVGFLGSVNRQSIACLVADSCSSGKRSKNKEVWRCWILRTCQ